jgi:hypothetical protein
MPSAATSVAGLPRLSTSSGAAFFDGTPMVMMAVADRDRRDRQPPILERRSGASLLLRSWTLRVWRAASTDAAWASL